MIKAGRKDAPATSKTMRPDVEEYMKDILICEDTTEENIYSLHQYCDCFIWNRF